MLGLIGAAGCGDDEVPMTTTDGGMDATNQDGATDAETPTQSIAEIVAGDARFSTLAAALSGAGLVDTFADEEGSFTVFAPTDDAFALLPEGLVAGLDAATLETVLKYHVVSGEVPAATAVTLDSADTLAEISLKLTVDGETLYLDGLTAVIETDVRATNGIVHVIDSVLIPGDFPGTLAELMAAYPRVSTVTGAAGEDVVAALSGEDDLTVFAPENAAFDGLELPEDQAALDSIILYHALAGARSAEAVVAARTLKTANGAYIAVQADDSGVALFDSMNTSNVLYADRTASNGVLHVIDTVVVPPGNLAEVATAAGLSTLVQFVTEADLAGAITGEDEYTIFAPTNEAFARLPEGADLSAVLADVLLHHVVAGVADSAAVATVIAAESNVETATGADDNAFTPTVVGDDIVIDGLTKVTAVDVPAANGVIHVIDSVMLPADIAFPGNLAEAAQAYPMLDSLVDAVINADAAVATALTGEDELTVFAPYNPAFAGVDTSMNLTPVLTYHVVAGANDSTAVVGLVGDDVETVNGATVAVEAGPTLRDGMDNVRGVVRVDLRTSNGIIHVIDGVLMPPS